MEKRFCTILTDASWCPQEHVAGWACWIVCDEGRYKRFDAFFEKVTSAMEAEIKAIINGVYIAKRVFQPTHYHVVSDCTTAMDMLQGKCQTKEWQVKLKDIIGDTTITFKHVRAHTNNKDKRSYVNNWCDFNAKVAMRQLRQIVKEEDK